MFDNRVLQKRIGWKQSYGLLRKKAMEQELSLSGLILSLSIAFFIVAVSASVLNFAFNSSLEKFQYDGRIIDGGQIIEVGNLAKLIIPTAQAAALDLKAQPIKDTEYLNATQGQLITQTVKLKNIGKDSWKPGVVSFQTGPSLKRISRVYTNSWLKFYEPINLVKEVKPGQSIDISFPVQIPSDLEGTIQENFHLVYNERPISGSLIRVFITITKPITVSPPKISSPPTIVNNPLPISSSPITSPSNPPIQTTSLDPIIRVGLFSFISNQRLSFNSIFDIYAGKEIIVSGVPANTVVTTSFDPASRIYAVVAANFSKTTALPLRFVPRDINGVASLLDYRNGPAWNPQASDNRFRGIIEIRYTEPAKKVWFINELPLENYLKGLAETTNASPLEFQKVMVTAARSYAYYHYNRGLQFGLTDASTKHADDHFHIDAYYDQVYRGYNSELRMPRLAAAVEATRGITVTYQNKTVVTPYFSNSDGRTRDWTEVWGGSAVPWLKSVAVPYDLGKTLFGHGVGMSARGALLMVNEGKTWDNVLKYFYTGISLAKAY